MRSGEFGTESTKIQEVADRLKATQKLVQDFIQRLRHERAMRFLANVSDKRPLRLDDATFQPKVLEFVNDLYDNVLTTVAFQSALIAGFFGEIERCNLTRMKANIEPINIAMAFDGYMSELNAFFSPSKSSDVRRLIEVFAGTPEGEIKDWKVGPSASTFRRVVYRGEMQPDQWPKYKYLLLEIWRADGTELAEASARPNAGVLVVIDELGKYLEIAADGGADIHFFQELAEAAARCDGRLLIVGVLHQSFDQYARRFGTEMQEEWAKIQGRFVDIPIVTAIDEVLDLIGRALTHRDGALMRSNLAWS